MSQEPGPRPLGLPSPAATRTSPAIVSYAQNAEDVRLWRVLSGVKGGFYVDIGAAHPRIGSVTQLFYERGWSGINVEPSPVFDLLATERERDVNLRAVVGPDDASATIHVTYPDLGLSTTDLAAHAHVPDAIDRVETFEVPQLRLATMLDRYGGVGRDISFLKVDVEGAETAVLASNDWHRHRPAIVLVEAVASWDSRPTYESWEPILLGHGYRFAAFDGINRYYVSDERAELAEGLAYPMSALDRYVTYDLVLSQQRVASLAAEVEALRRETARSRAGESLARRARAEIWRLRELSEDLERYAGALETDVADARAQIEQLTYVADHYREAYESVLASRTWQAGKAAWLVARPAVRVARRLAGPAPVAPATVAIEVATSDEVAAEPAPLAPLPADPAAAYAEAVRVPGHVWSFVPEDLETDPLLTPIEAVLDTTEVDAGAVSALVAAARERAAETLPASHRAALHEVEAMAYLLGHRSKRAASAGVPGATGWGRIVVDARCLQHPHFTGRGVGKHARRVLQAVRAAAGARPITLLADPALPPLPADIAAVSDVVANAAQVPAGDTELVVCLSAMTDSAAPLVPWLVQPEVTSVAVVFDFIPAELPGIYLRHPAERLAYRARLAALRTFDVGLCISATTARALAERAPGVRPVVSGVGDPLDAPPERALGASAPAFPYVLAPSGSDPRKNLLAAVAAVARYRATHPGGRSDLGVVAAGRIEGILRDGVVEFSRVLGLPDTAVSLPDHVDDEELDRLYRGAVAVVVPSFAEGFSIPVAEAVRRHAPVVASDIAVHREVLGEGWWLVPPGDVEALAAALARALGEAPALSAAQEAHLGDLAAPEAVSARLKAVFAELLALPDGAPDRVAEPRPHPSRGRAGPRPKLAVVSPFPPLTSGVADHTAFVAGHLSALADVTVCPTNADAQAPGGAAYRLSPLNAGVYLDGKFDAVLSVAGNSLYHVPVLECLADYGGPCLAHDNRMVEVYRAWLGGEAAAELVSSPGHPVSPEQLEHMLRDLDTLPDLGYGPVAHQAAPLIVHAHDLADRIARETGVTPHVLPFVPYNLPSEEALGRDARNRAREACGLDPTVTHVATFGLVDRRTKAADVLIDAMAWLRAWDVPCHLHFVGPVPPHESLLLRRFAAELGVAGRITFHGRVDRAAFERWLLATDLAVQLRTSSVLSLSGALADCIVHGTTTITNARVAAEMGAPSYVRSLPDRLSPLLLAEAIAKMASRAAADAAHAGRADQREAERRRYLEAHSGERYAAELLEVLGFEVQGFEVPAR